MCAGIICTYEICILSRSHFKQQGGWQVPSPAPMFTAQRGPRQTRQSPSRAEPPATRPSASQQSRPRGSTRSPLAALPLRGYRDPVVALPPRRPSAGVIGRVPRLSAPPGFPALPPSAPMASTPSLLPLAQAVHAGPTAAAPHLAKGPAVAETSTTVFRLPPVAPAAPIVAAGHPAQPPKAGHIKVSATESNLHLLRVQHMTIACRVTFTGIHVSVMTPQCGLPTARQNPPLAAATASFQKH